MPLVNTCSRVGAGKGHDLLEPCSNRKAAVTLARSVNLWYLERELISHLHR